MTTASNDSDDRPTSVGTIFSLFGKFVNENRSLSTLWGSIIVTGFFADFTFASLIVHVINIAILFGVREAARHIRRQFFLTFVLFLVSISLSAFMSQTNIESAVIQILNAIALMFMCYFSSNEFHVPQPAKSASS